MTILEEKADMGSVDLQYSWSIRQQLLFANLVRNLFFYF